MEENALTDVSSAPWLYSDVRSCCCQSVHAFTSMYDSTLLGCTIFTQKAFLHEISITEIIQTTNLILFPLLILGNLSMKYFIGQSLKFFILVTLWYACTMLGFAGTICLPIMLIVIRAYLMQAYPCHAFEKYLRFYVAT